MISRALRAKVESRRALDGPVEAAARRRRNQLKKDRIRAAKAAARAAEAAAAAEAYDRAAAAAAVRHARAAAAAITTVLPARAGALPENVRLALLAEGPHEGRLETASAVGLAIHAYKSDKSTPAPLIARMAWHLARGATPWGCARTPASRPMTRSYSTSSAHKQTTRSATYGRGKGGAGRGGRGGGRGYGRGRGSAGSFAPPSTPRGGGSRRRVYLCLIEDNTGTGPKIFTHAGPQSTLEILLHRFSRFGFNCTAEWAETFVGSRARILQSARDLVGF